MANSSPNHSARWWAKNIVVPLVGGGGLVTLLVALINVERTNPEHGQQAIGFTQIQKADSGQDKGYSAKKYDQQDILLVAGADVSYADPGGRRLVGLPPLGGKDVSTEGSTSLLKMAIPSGSRILEPIKLVQTDAEKGSLRDFIIYSVRLQDGTKDSIMIKGYSQRPGVSLRVGGRLEFSVGP
jgi:hypothetical protein